MNVTRTHESRCRSAAMDARLTIALALCLLPGLIAGCANIQLPAVDPSGEHLFLPCPNTTSLTLPCNDCFNRIEGEGPFCCLPTPAFRDPPLPPPCLADDGTMPPAAEPEQAESVDECAIGPKAELFDTKHAGAKQCLHKLLHLPETGKRGRILLNHRKIIAPVGGEVILLSGVCGTDGHLVMNEELQWMLTPDSVGHIIDVGDDKGNMLHRLVSSPKVEKRSGSYAIGRTSTRASLITRGNLKRTDDVHVRKGEAWLSISSPSEGISRLTVMAPESDCWDQRKATATIYWVDAHWQFPASLILRAGEQAQLVTRVMRKEGELPAIGWRVQYEVLNPEVALFDDGTNTPASLVEATVDDNGNAAAILRPIAKDAGAAMVRATVMRPAGLDEALPQMTLGSGQTLITWSAPKLAVRVGAAPFVAQDETFPIGINVANTGDMTAENVRITTRLPTGVELVDTLLVQPDGSRVPAESRVVGDQVLWDLGEMPAQTQLDIEMNVKAKADFRLTAQARAAEGLMAEGNVDVTVVQRSLQVSIAVANPNARIEVGQEVAFNITVTNTGSAPISGAQLVAMGDDAMLAYAQDTGQWQPRVVNELKEPLQPGKPWRMQATYQVRQPGRHCVRATATGGTAQRATETACITAVAPPPPNPMASAQIRMTDKPVQQGDSILVKYLVGNPGTVPLTNVRVAVTFDPGLVPLQFTEGYDQTKLELFATSWIIPRLMPGESRPVETEFRADGAPGPARVDVAISNDQNVFAAAERTIQILPRSQQPPANQYNGNGPGTSGPGTSGPAPIGPPPNVGSTAPVPGTGTGNGLGNAGPGNNGTIGSGVQELQVRLSARNNPVAVGEQSAFDLVVENHRATPDDDVQIHIYVPAGARLEAVRSTMIGRNPIENSTDGLTRLQTISQLRPGEAIEYTIIFVSSVPQTMTVRAEASSRLSPRPVGDETSITVQPL